MDGLITSTTPTPPKIIVYGQPGVGKSTFAGSANALLIDCENGAGNIPGLQRTPYLESWKRIHQWITNVITYDGNDISAVAIDTADWLVRRIVEYVTIDLDGRSRGDVTNTIGSAHGGFFKARDIVKNIINRELLPGLNRITAKGIPVILLAHAENSVVKSPEGHDYRLAVPAIAEYVRDIFIEWADAVLYAKVEGDRRTLVTTGTNVILAKNRYSLPPIIDLSWPAFIQAAFPQKTANTGEQNNG